jgi:hypothetical protein
MCQRKLQLSAIGYRLSAKRHKALFFYGLVKPEETGGWALQQWVK